MDESLVKKIVTLIMADPRFQAMFVGSARNEASPKQVAVVVADNEAAVALLPKLQDRWRDSFSLQVCLDGSVAATKIELPQRSFQEVMTDKSWSRLLIPVCSGKQLAEIALGLQGTSISALAAEAILRGIPVEISRVNFAFTERTPVAYRKLFESYVEKVAAYGVIIDTGIMPPAELATPVSVTSPSVPILTKDLTKTSVLKETTFHKEVLYDKNLMTEKEAVLLPEQAVLNLSRATIITPSAIDALKHMKVQVYREGVRYL